MIRTYVVAACPSSLSGKTVIEWQGRCLHVSDSESVSADDHEDTCQSYFGSDATGIILKSESDDVAFNDVQ